MTPEISRRRLMAIGGGALGAAAAGSFLPPSLREALAHEPPRGSGLDSIEHVVILMQENRSFDHYFGSLRGVRGFGDRNAIRLPGGTSVFEQPGGPRTVLPFPVREAAKTQKKDLQYIGDLDHSWSGGAKAWRDGWMDGWITAKTAATMAYYTREDIPLHYELADTFTVCDAYHSSIHTSTSPNRNHLWSGRTGYEANGKRAVGNDAYAEGTHPGYGWGTYAERLEKAGVSWRTYTEWENFTDNQIEFFTTFKAIARKALVRTGLTFMEAFYAKVRDARDETERAKLLATLEEGVATLDKRERSLFERGLRRVPTGRLAEEFAKDVAGGKLAKVTYLVPSALDSEHPGVSSPIHSATIVYRILDALASHPEVWRRTAVFINYDENDGFFDHVPPPVPGGDFAEEREERWEGRPTGLGVRVPMLVVSPWTVGGYVCSEVFDHTSVVRFLEKWTGVKEPNISAWRRKVTGDLTGAFDFRRAHRQPDVERPGPIPAFSGRWKPQPPLKQSMPVQEPGVRRARPLPYQPDADVRPAEDGTLTVRLRNGGSSSAHFALYPYAGEFPVPQHQDVVRKGSWTVPVPGDTYAFTVTGPNGFRREFAGGMAGGGGKGGTAGEGGRDGGARLASAITRREIHLTLASRGRADLVFTVKPLGYVDEEDIRRRTRTVRVRAGSSRTVAWRTDDEHGWYDIEVTTDRDTAFRRRLMGHIENGRASVSG
ncbi:phosphocholine-specific phospholipase C [Streptomyces alboniger]|uniref:phospholipase C n=1 Tax=Streptomyces alboniger TaxID=132473 RepID=A0A5J6HJ86_STRAD|nr:phospholipase C, phosphocholine-specific [Streptomyces alboniger]QEV20399.1 phospholipase C, phosphocholine-specific [Streptomyces alboniger]